MTEKAYFCAEIHYLGNIVARQNSILKQIHNLLKIKF